MEYQRFDPTDCGFPKPKVPVLPALTMQSLGASRAREFQLVSEANPSVFFSRGRYALTAAYRMCGVGRSGSLLAPSYHCRSMLDPALRLDAQIVLYSLNLDLSVDVDALAQTVLAAQAASSVPIKAMLVTHYFGFTQNLAPLVAFCAQHGIMLIEDCSHALFSRATKQVAISNRSDADHRDDLPLGKTGFVCIGSPYKFFASEDGGSLWAPTGQSPSQETQTSPGLMKEVKGLMTAFKRAAATTSTGLQPPSVAEFAAARANGLRTGADLRLCTTSTSNNYDTRDESYDCLAVSRWVMRRTHIDRAAAQRRQNYQQWVDAVANLPHCRALFPELPGNCVPYMFALELDYPHRHFFPLKQLGMPIWRWDDMAVSPCATARRYRLHLLHLPCHQALNPAQMTWMVAVVSDVMRQIPAESQA
jgi:perosamine synthetase